MTGLRRTILSAFLILAASFTASSQSGSEAYSFLNLPTSTLAYGLGGINISQLEDNVYSTDRNPALLGPEIDMQLGVNYMRYIGQSNFAGAKFAHSSGDHAAWAAGIQYFGYGKMQGANSEGILTGEFSPSDLVFSGTYSHDINSRWRGGATLKFIYSSYDSFSAVAIATDLGVNYYDPDNDFSFSAVVANLGGQVKKFQDRYNKLPIDVQLGVSKSFGNFPVVFSLTAWNLTKWHLPYYDNGDGTDESSPRIVDKFGKNLFRHLVFGADFIPSQNFHIGIGYNYKTRTDMATYKRSFLSGFSLGMGLDVKQFGIGLALSQPHNGATTIMLNLSTKLYEFRQKDNNSD